MSFCRGTRCRIPWVVLRVHVFKAERADCSYLRDVFAGFCPVKMGSISRHNDHSAGRICLQLVGIELIAQTDVKDSGDDRVYAVFGVAVRHKFHAAGHLDPDGVRTWLRRLAYLAILTFESDQRVPTTKFCFSVRGAVAVGVARGRCEL